MNKYLLLVILIIVVVTSCSLEKRHYTKGYNISWSSHNRTKKKTEATKTEAVKAPENLSASLDNSNIVINNTINFSELFSAKRRKPEKDSCDNIILKSGEEVRGKVTEIDFENIKYKKCENLDGPIHYLQKSDVFLIQYANGTTEKITEIKKEEKTYTSSPTVPDVIYPNTEGFGLAGFFTSYLTIIPVIIFQKTSFLYFLPSIYLALIIGIICTIFGIISIIRGAIKPKHFKAKGLGIVSLILGLLIIIACAIFMTFPLLIL